MNDSPTIFTASEGTDAIAHDKDKSNYLAAFAAASFSAGGREMSRSRAPLTSLLKLKKDIERKDDTEREVSSPFHGGWFSLVLSSVSVVGALVLVVGAAWFLAWLTGWP